MLLTPASNCSAVPAVLLSCHRLAAVNTGLLVALLLLALLLTAQCDMVPPHVRLYSAAKPCGSSNTSEGPQASSQHVRVQAVLQASSGQMQAVLKQMQASSEHVDAVLKQFQASSDRVDKILQQGNAALQKGLAAVQLAATKAAAKDAAGEANE
jgi:hypothetical protein